MSVRQAHKHATMVKRWTEKNCCLCMPILWYCFLPSVHTGLLSWYRLAVFLIVDCLLSSEVSPATRWATKQFCCNVVVHRGAKRIIDSSTVHEQAPTLSPHNISGFGATLGEVASTAVMKGANKSILMGTTH